MKSRLSQLSEIIKSCSKCPLHTTRTNVVFGEGNLNADIMFIGEAPGRNEDLQGRPFIGRAGQLLDKMLEEANLSREEIYITNIVKCRPPKNRDPERDEIAACVPYLDKQIEDIKPKILVGLGRYSSKYLFEKYGLEFPGISLAHGRPYKVDNLYNHLILFPMYHPAAAIYNQKLRPTLIEDFKILKSLLD